MLYKSGAAAARVRALPLPAHFSHPSPIPLFARDPPAPSAPPTPGSDAPPPARPAQLNVERRTFAEMTQLMATLGFTREARGGETPTKRSCAAGKIAAPRCR